MPRVDSLSPRQRSGERVRERGFQLAAPIRWKVPLSPALSPLVPRREREWEASTMVVVSRCDPSARGAFQTLYICRRSVSLKRTPDHCQSHYLSLALSVTIGWPDCESKGAVAGQDG